MPKARIQASGEVKRSAATPSRISKRRRTTTKHVEFENGASMTQWRVTDLVFEEPVQESPMKKRGGKKGPGTQDLAERETLMKWAMPKRGRHAQQAAPELYTKNEKEAQTPEKLDRLAKQQDPKHQVAGWTTADTDNPQQHFHDNHIDAWVTACDKAGIRITAKSATAYVEAWRCRQHREAGSNVQHDDGRPQFSKELFVDYIVEWIVTDDQSLSVVDNPRLRNIFLLLHSELHDKDIPHRTTIQAQVGEVFEEYLDELSQDMQNAAGKISFTMDMWTDPHLFPYMAVTAHWLHLILSAFIVSLPGTQVNISQLHFFIFWIISRSLMRAILLREAIEKFLHGAEFADLRKYSLNSEEWKALQIFPKILQIPHAFQQILSSQSTPMLINILPAFEAMKQCWEDRQTQLPHAADIIQQGLDKLADYRDRNWASDAYILATIINPAHKLEWFEQNSSQEKVHDAEKLFLAEVLHFFV
ncbi:uncharacterized protein PHACADRAFT_201634 [Phanerochaete carnosa HHB-10118-sp]|uniref:hAT-like transposase RNase-H fold domain-containing protein n=1 Tax=Phanerochaete carnosa (strain HHB-10118-sp) TaxID=650164 RepID=K5VS46_PHACS|nr:uncharacterized protein PHACADRAFT_201634 [Phanerochaete carnosa HHB-10118-sp]EKM49379.1 hypothetical protein PHACADRAFT_201634 [Phanerochaete carnosa HHB-10118-sp]